MSYLTTKDFLLEVARGKVTGASIVRRVGLNPDIDTAGEEDVAYGGGDLTWGTSAVASTTVSTSTNDISSTGTGVRTLIVTGLDASYAEVTEVISLNGTTTVNHATNLLYADKAEIVTTGSVETNDGTITIASNNTLTMPAGFGQTYQAAYTIPAGKTGYLIGWQASLYKAVSGSVEFRLYTAEDTVGWRIQAVQELTQTGAGLSSFSNQDLMLVLPAKTRIKVRAKTSADNMGVMSGFTLLLM